MLYLTCTTITSVDLAHYGVSRAKDRVSVDCGTIPNIRQYFLLLQCNKKQENHSNLNLRTITTTRSYFDRRTNANDMFDSFAVSKQR